MYVTSITSLEWGGGNMLLLYQSLLLVHTQIQLLEEEDTHFMGFLQKIEQPCKALCMVWNDVW